MTDTHEFIEGENGRCVASLDGTPGFCGRGRSADVHDFDAPYLKVSTTGDQTAPRPLSPGTRRQPWAELPAPSKAAAWALGGSAAALLVCLVATACRLILSAGGWLG